MKCPDCGVQTGSEHPFCRSCGANLWADDPRVGVPSPLVGILLAFVGVILALTGRMLLHEEIITYIGAITSIIGMMSIAVIPLIAAKQARERRYRAVSRPERFAPVEPTMKLPPVRAMDEIPSVVDHTTELLHEPLSGRERR